jgi:hypothetical protein
MNFPIAYARGCDPNSKVENAMVEKKHRGRGGRHFFQEKSSLIPPKSKGSHRPDTWMVWLM